MASNLFGMGSWNSFNRSGNQPQAPSMGHSRKRILSSFNTASMKRPQNQHIGVNQPSRSQHVQGNRLFVPPTRRDVTKNDRNGPQQVAAPPSFPAASIQEGDSDNKFIDIEMSQLTMSQSSFMEHQDTLSHRSSCQSSSKPSVAFPPLHQSSGASSHTSSFARSNPHSTASNSSRGLGNIIPAALLRNVSTTPFKNPVLASLAVATSANRTPSLMMDNQSRDDRSIRSMGRQSLIESSKSRLRMTTPSRISNDNHSGGPVLMRFRHASSKANSIFTQRSLSRPLEDENSANSCIHTQRSLSQPAVDKNSANPSIHAQRYLSQPSADENSANSLPSNQAQPSEPTPCKPLQGLVAEDSEKRLKQIHEELKAQVSEQIEQLNSKITDIDKEIHARVLEQLNVKFIDMDKEIHSRVSEQMQELQSDAKAAISQETNTNIQKLDSAAKGHLAAMSKSAEASISKIGEISKAAKDSIMNKGVDLVNAALPLLQNPIKTMVDSMFVTLSNNNRNVPVSLQAISSTGPTLEVPVSTGRRKNNCSKTQEETKRTNEKVESDRVLLSKKRRIASLSQETSSEIDVTQPSRPPTEGRILRSKRQHIAALSQEASSENDAPQTSKPPVERRSKRRRKDLKDRSEKENITPVSKITRSFVTPCKKLSEEQVSPTPTVSLAKAKSISNKHAVDDKNRKRNVSPLGTRSTPQADLSQYLFPTEVLLMSPVGSLSPLSIPPLPRVEKNVCKSPVLTKRRARRAPPQLKNTRVKRSRTYGSNAWKKTAMQDSSFTFL